MHRDRYRAYVPGNSVHVPERRNNLMKDRRLVMILSLSCLTLRTPGNKRLTLIQSIENIHGYSNCVKSYLCYELIL